LATCQLFKESPGVTQTSYLLYVAQKGIKQSRGKSLFPSVS